MMENLIGENIIFKENDNLDHAFNLLKERDTKLEENYLKITKSVIEEFTLKLQKLASDVMHMNHLINKYIVVIKDNKNTSSTIMMGKLP